MSHCSAPLNVRSVSRWARSLPYSKTLLRSRYTRRPFHQTSSQRQLVEPALAATHDLLEAVHTATGLPWIYSLPLCALILRATITAPLAVYVQRVSQRQFALSPLLQAWQHRIARQIFTESRSLGPVECEKRIKKAVKRKRAEIFHRWGCGRWKLALPALQFPIFLVAIETIRRMCGTREGLLGLGLKQFRSGDVAVDVDTSRDAALESLTAHSTLFGVEESFSHEGGLWFQDLLAPDPLLLLPFILSGTLLAITFYTSRSRSGVVRSRFQRRLSNILKVLALSIGPATLQVSSAMLVYWISSASLALCQNILLDRLMPLPTSLPLPKKPEKMKRSGVRKGHLG